MGLVGEGLHDPHPADILLDPRIEGPDPAVLGLPVAGHAAAVADRHEGDQRQDRRRDQRQRRVHREHQREGAQQRHHGDEQVLGPVMGDLADLLQVLGHPGDEVAGLLAVVEAEGELLQVVEGPFPQGGLDVDAEHVAPVGDHHHQAGIGHVDQRQRRGGEQDQAPILPGQEAVDEALHGDGEAEFEQAGQHRAAEIDQEQRPVRPVIGEEGLQHRAARISVGRRTRRGRARRRTAPPAGAGAGSRRAAAGTPTSPDRALAPGGS